MRIDLPLHTLDIILDSTFTDRRTQYDTATGVLRANKTQLIMRSTYRELLAERNSILEARGFRIPEDWDLEWNVHLGPVWTPASESSTTIWLSPEYLHEETETTGGCGSDRGIAMAEDRSGNNYDFIQAACDLQPDLSSAKPSNGFFGMLSSSASLPENMSNSGEGAESSLYDSSVTPASGDRRVIALYVYSGIDQGVDIAAVISNGAANNNGGDTDDFNIRKSDSGSDVNWEIDWGNVVASSATLTHSSMQTIIAGTHDNNTVYIKVDGGTATTAASSGSNLNAIANTEVYLAGTQSSSGVQKPFDGVIYEVVVLHTSRSDALDEKLEGYFAHKYGQQVTLPSTHPYKTDPPRAELV